MGKRLSNFNTGMGAYVASYLGGEFSITPWFDSVNESRCWLSGIQDYPAHVVLIGGMGLLVIPKEAVLRLDQVPVAEIPWGQEVQLSTGSQVLTAALEGLQGDSQQQKRFDSFMEDTAVRLSYVREGSEESLYMVFGSESNRHHAYAHLVEICGRASID